MMVGGFAEKLPGLLKMFLQNEGDSRSENSFQNSGTVDGKVCENGNVATVPEKGSCRARKCRKQPSARKGFEKQSNASDVPEIVSTVEMHFMLLGYRKGSCSAHSSDVCGSGKSSRRACVRKRTQVTEMYVALTEIRPTFLGSWFPKHIFRFLSFEAI